MVAVYFVRDAAFTARNTEGIRRNEVIVHRPALPLQWRLAVVTGAATFGILIITAGLFLIVPRTATRGRHAVFP